MKFLFDVIAYYKALDITTKEQLFESVDLLTKEEVYEETGGAVGIHFEHIENSLFWDIFKPGQVWEVTLTKISDTPPNFPTQESNSIKQL